MRQPLSVAIYGLSAMAGLVAFVYPLFAGVLLGPERAAASQAETPLLAMALLLLGMTPSSVCNHWSSTPKSASLSSTCRDSASSSSLL